MRFLIEYLKYTSGETEGFTPPAQPLPDAFKATYWVREYHYPVKSWRMKAMLDEKGDPYIGKEPVPDEVAEAWTETGRNHKTVGETLIREVEREGWFVDFTDIEALFQLVQEREAEISGVDRACEGLIALRWYVV